MSNIQIYARKISNQVFYLTFVPLALIFLCLTVSIVYRYVSIEQKSLLKAIALNVASSAKVGDTFQLKKLAASLVESGALDALDISTSYGVVPSYDVSGLLEGSKNRSLFFQSGTLISIHSIEIDEPGMHEKIYIKSAKLFSASAILLIIIIFISLFVFCALLLKISIKRIAYKLSTPIKTLSDKITSDTNDDFLDNVSFNLSELNAIWHKHRDSLLKLRDHHFKMSRLRVSEAIARTTQVLAHDVRKPLSMVRMLSEIITTMDDPLEIREYLESSLPELNKAISSADGMIADVLEIGSPGKLALATEAIENLLFCDPA